VTDYNAPLDDIKFCLRYAAGLDEILQLSAYEGVEIDDVDPILDEAGRFARDVVAPTNRIGDEQGVSVTDGTVKVPAEFAELNQQLVENGWPALGGSPEHDGMGLPETVEFATSELWQSANMAFSLLTMLTRDATHLLKAHASDELKQTYLPKITTGEWAATMDLTEPQAGSDLAAVKAKAIPDGDAYRIFGNKVYITWGDHELTENIIHLVLARIDGAPEGVRGISLFLVPKFLLDADGNPGERNDLVATSVEHKLGIHGSPTCVLNYGEGNGAIGYLVGEENKGLAAMFTMMNHARVEVGLQGVAISERACQLARSYAHDRVQGRVPGQSERAPIIYHADVRRMLLLMRSQTEAMRALAYATASQLDKLHHDEREEAQKAAELRLSLLTPVVKGWNTETAQEVTSLGVQIHGGMGYVEETGAAQHMRDARILPIYEGTTGIQALDFAGRKVLGDEGREVGLLIGELRGACDAMEKDDALQSVGRDVRQGLEQLEQGVAWLRDNATENPAAIGTASVNLLMLAGVVLGGAYLAKATLALRSDGESVDAAFADTKLATTRFYCTHVLPRAHGYLAAATADPGATMDLDVDSI
jgi:acyl-CoA dehydrogenase